MVCAKNSEDSASSTEAFASTNPPSESFEKSVRAAALFAHRTQPQTITAGNATATHATATINNAFDVCSSIRRPDGSLLVP